MFESYTMLLRYAIMIAAGAYGVNGEMTELLVAAGLIVFGLVWKHAEIKGWVKGI